MDGFTGFKTATTEELPDAVAVMDPFHVVRLAGDALDRCRRRVQQSLHGHRGRKDDPLYRARRTLHTGADLLTDKQKARLDGPVRRPTSTSRSRRPGAIYQRMIAAYRDPDRAAGPRADGDADRLAQPRRPEGADRGRHAGSDPEEARR